MKLVFITQQVDPDHPALAATVPEDRRARAARGRGRRARGRRGRGRPAGELPRADVSRVARRPGAARASRPRSPRELRGLRGGAVVAHMCPIYAVLAAPLVRPLGVPLLLWFTHWRASRLLQAAERVSTAVISVDRRSFPLESDKVRAIGHGIDLSEFSCAPSRSDDDGLRLLALGRYSPAKGLDVVLRAIAAVDDGVRLDVHGPALSAEEQAHRAELERLAHELPLDGRVDLVGPGAARRDPGAAREPRRAREQHARGRARQGRLRGRGSMCAGARLEPGLRHAARPRAALQPRRPRRARRPDPRARDAVAPPSGRRSASVCASASRRATRSTRGRAVSSTAAGLAMSDVVLHTQKVAGISGSEAHLLQLLPDLRERGWDVRFLMLHEDEPGAWEFARELEARGVPLDEIRLRADVDPLAFGQVVSYLGRQRPQILHTHLVHADVYGQLAGTMARVPLAALDEARLQRVPGRAASSVSPTAPSARSRTCTSRSRRGSRSTSPRRRASTRRASRSSTTGSRPRTALARTRGRSRGFSASAG